MKKIKLLLILVLSFNVIFAQDARSLHSDCAISAKQDTIRWDIMSSYKVLDSHDYSFNELLDEAVTTFVHYFDFLGIQVNHYKTLIKGHVKRHHFALNKGEREETTFRAVSFSYPSVSPDGEQVMLSGLVTFPVRVGNCPEKMLIYHRVLAVGKNPPPSDKIPLEAVLTADNTICVFPDYYGCGTTKGEHLPFISLHYHAKCATECALVALNIVKDCGVDLASDFYTWTTGYSQGAGFALATHRFVENVLSDSLAHLINLRWSFCGGGVYAPNDLYKEVARSKYITEPAVFLLGLQSLFYGHRDNMDSLTFCDLISPELLNFGIDSVLDTYDCGLYDLSKRLRKMYGHAPANYLNPLVLDTSTCLFNTLETAFALDDCISDWAPQSPVVLFHSKKDKCIPYRLAEQAHTKLSTSGSNRCFLYSPFVNGSHRFNGFFFFAKILRIREDELYKKYFIRKQQ